MKRVLIGLMFALCWENAFAVTCLTFDTSGCTQYSPTGYTDDTGVTAMYKCSSSRVDIVGICGTEISGGELVYSTTNLNDNGRCFCRITYPFLSDWVTGGGCYNPAVGTIGCVSNCAELLNGDTVWTPYR